MHVPLTHGIYKKTCCVLKTCSMLIREHCTDAFYIANYNRISFAFAVTTYLLALRLLVMKCAYYVKKVVSHRYIAATFYFLSGCWTFQLRVSHLNFRCIRIFKRFHLLFDWNVDSNRFFIWCSIAIRSATVKFLTQAIYHIFFPFYLFPSSTLFNLTTINQKERSRESTVQIE